MERPPTVPPAIALVLEVPEVEFGVSAGVVDVDVDAGVDNVDVDADMDVNEVDVVESVEVLFSAIQEIY